MNRLSHGLISTLKILFLSYALFFLPTLSKAQFIRHFPIVDLTTDVIGWTQKTGSFAAQVSAFQWLGLRAGVAYGPQQSQNDNFITKSESFEFLGEARLFPFGPPRKAFKKDTRPAFWKKPKVGCSGKYCLNMEPQTGVKKILTGLFVAPGYSFQRQNASFVPKGNLNAPISEFRSHIINQGPVLTAGYQIRLRNITIGLGYEIKASQPQWNSQEGAVIGRYMTTESPWKLNFQRKWCLEAGINF